MAERQITGMWEQAGGAPLSDEGARHAIDVLSRLSAALRPEDDITGIEVTIGPRVWQFRPLPPLLLAMPTGGPTTAILGPQGLDDG